MTADEKPKIKDIISLNLITLDTRNANHTGAGRNPAENRVQGGVEYPLP